MNTWEERGVDGRLLGRSESDAEIVFSVKGQAPTLFLPRSLSRAALTDVAPVAELSTYAGADNLAAVWVIAPPTGGSRDLEISFGAGGIRGEFQDKKTLKVRIMGGPSEREVSTQIASALKAYGEHLVKAGDQVQGQEIVTYGEDGKPASRTQFQRQKARDGRAELVPLTTPNPYLVALSITPGVSSPVPIRSAEERAQLVQAPNWLASHRGPQGWVSFVRVGRTGFASLETWDLERPTLGVQSKMFLYASSGIIEPRRTVLWRLQKAGEGAGVDKTIEIETFEPRANSFRARSKVLRRQVDEKEKTSKP